MKHIRLIVSLLAVAAVTLVFVWWVSHRDQATGELVLYGNVDLRQVELPFNNSERIAAVLVEEGDRVKPGQVVARLDTARLDLQLADAEGQAAAQRKVVERLHNGSRAQEIAQATAQAEAQRQIVERLHNGSRPEEIAQARANVESARADAAAARQQYERVSGLVEKWAVSQQEFDDAKAALEVANARLFVNQKALELALAGPRKEEVAEAEARLAALQKALELVVIGPRQEEIAEAEARLQAAEAQVGLLRQILKDAELVAPMKAVVRTRIMEPGEMTSPQKPVLSLAITDPKWVRAYVSERDLGNVQPGMPATVAIDTFPDRRFAGWVGFVSPVAEFTPKTVQTKELRTSLVYEIRVFVNDPQDVLRLGMPATVRLEPGSGGAADGAVAAGGPTAEPAR